ncbi:MAG: hypothetical protein C4520_00475 [Candidatus Abyssobacteria bacterium SURF_5]|uniref:Uncharacterized protein n=1 Tax=Abyssobacteria bacterium (strain SURF_5) TaxID=2093360 RepID=A0A3A4P1M5_ABYX5|nr:MAG: hypothetical protein C4520_00475 [Candidatus Abyssubacteria bacterium SURF_5]
MNADVGARRDVPVSTIGKTGIQGWVLDKIPLNRRSQRERREETWERASSILPHGITGQR